MSISLPTSSGASSGAAGHQPSLRQGRFQTLRNIVALMLREMSSTYGRNPGGYLWAFIEPLGAVAIMTLGFSLFMRNPPLGTNFVLFFATGFLPFSLYLTIGQKVQQALGYSRPLLAYPRVTWIDAVLARFILTLLTQMTIMACVLAGILIFYDTHTILDLVPILEGVLILALGGLGIGVLNGIIGGIWPVWLVLWSIVNRPLFLASGLFFLYESLPPLVQSILWWNPILHAIALIRSGFYSTYEPAFFSAFYCFTVALVLIAAGLLFMRRWHKLALER